jgi:spore germination cell wall hydrolase CwlJ-like protein
MKTLKAGVLALALLTSIGLGTASLAAPKTPYVSRTELHCLAKNIYMEARGEPLEGQIAVAQVTVNRVRDPAYHSTVCGVVYAYKQFSWTLGKRKQVVDQKAWRAALDISRAVLTQSIPLPHFPATHFHTRQVKPYWAKTKTRVAVIGNHIFYS